MSDKQFFHDIKLASSHEEVNQGAVELLNPAKVFLKSREEPNVEYNRERIIETQNVPIVKLMRQEIRGLDTAKMNQWFKDPIAIKVPNLMYRATAHVIEFPAISIKNGIRTVVYDAVEPKFVRLGTTQHVAWDSWKSHMELPHSLESKSTNAYWAVLWSASHHPDRKFLATEGQRNDHKK